MAVEDVVEFGITDVSPYSPFRITSANRFFPASP
jgi:hypothetical protein